MAEAGDRREALERRIDLLEHLASPPVSLDRILALASDPEAGVAELGEAVRIDPAITARILRLANSAYFGFARRVESVEEAVMVVGFRNLRNLAACVAVAPVFSGDDDGLDRMALWRHSCGVAEATRLVAVHQASDDGAAYVAGLLHDIGQVVLAECLGDEYRVLVERQPRPAGRLSDLESAELGADHAWAGGEVCERWQLSPRVVDAVRSHHDETGAAGTDAARVALAEHLVEREGLGDPLDPPRERSDPPEALLEALDLSGEAVEELAAALAERREAIELLYQESRG